MFSGFMVNTWTVATIVAVVQSAPRATRGAGVGGRAAAAGAWAGARVAGGIGAKVAARASDHSHERRCGVSGRKSVIHTVVRAV